MKNKRIFLLKDLLKSKTLQLMVEQIIKDSVLDLTKVEPPGTYILGQAYQETPIIEARIPASVTSYGTSIFYKVTTLKKITFESLLVVVPTQLLYSTTSLSSIVVGKTEVLSGGVLDLSLVKITDVQ
jgi:hypothetical protein